jgi:hypothetical protein
MTLATYSIVPIVEGFSEVESVPVLMRRLRDSWGKYDLEIAKPVRVKRYGVIKEGELERRVQMAMTRPNCKAVMVILDADDDCPKDTGMELLKRAKVIAQDTTVSVVLPKSELESWFVGSVESLRGVRSISANACSPNDPETIRGAKEFLTSLMERHYVETVDQPAFAAKFDMTKALENCRSFRKFHGDFRRIVDSLSPKVETT